MTPIDIPQRPETGARLTPRAVAVMLALALALFAAAYGIALLYGRAADDQGRAAAVAAEAVSGMGDVTLRAKNVAFDTDKLAAAADQPLVIRIENEDAGIYHNIAVYRDSGASDLVVRGELFDGPSTRQYRFDGFSAGTYSFQCDLHPMMNGTLVVR